MLITSAQYSDSHVHKAVIVAVVAIVLASCASGPEYSSPLPPPPAQERLWVSPIIDALDRNHDGIIDSNEIANAPAALMTLDKNKDGQLTYDEIHWPDEPERRSNPEPVVTVLDANHDDIIDANEIANAATALRKLDKNGDGQLTPDEYTPPHYIHIGRSEGSHIRGPVPHGHYRGLYGAPPSPPVGEQQ